MNSVTGQDRCGTVVGVVLWLRWMDVERRNRCGTVWYVVGVVLAVATLDGWGMA